MRNILFSVFFAAASFNVFGQSDIPREPGVSVRMYDIGHRMAKLRPLVSGQTPNVSKVVPTIDMRGKDGDFEPLSEYFLLIADGFLNVERAGRYEFELTSDDGSVFWIDNNKVVDNDGEHGTISKTGAVELDAGLHPFTVKFFQGPGEANLWLKWKRPGDETFSIIPNSVLSCRRGEVRHFAR